MGSAQWDRGSPKRRLGSADGRRRESAYVGSPDRTSDALARHRRAYLVAFTEGLAAQAENDAIPSLAHTPSRAGHRGDRDTLD
jgi:hypothetical protein